MQVPCLPTARLRPSRAVSRVWPAGAGRVRRPRPSGSGVDAPMSVTVEASHDGHGADASRGAKAKAGFWALALGSVGVVYGDIGTSPLYALREALHHAQEGGVTREEVLGVTSLLLWALIFIVTGKYVLFLMRADNRGEGGTLSLMALAQRALGRSTPAVFLLGVAGAALFYGDALITPAISVLSAVEGLKLVTPVFEPYVIPITVAILLALFAAQRQGTGKVAALFGPITACWFLTMAALGLLHLQDDLGVLAAFNPGHAFGFLFSPRRGRLRRPRQRVPGGHRDRGALRRHGPFRPRADPGRLGRARVPGPGAELSRPGRAGPEAPRGAGQSVLPAGARTGRCCRW